MEKQFIKILPTYSRLFWDSRGIQMLTDVKQLFKASKNSEIKKKASRISKEYVYAKVMCNNLSFTYVIHSHMKSDKIFLMSLSIDQWWQLQCLSSMREEQLKVNFTLKQISSSESSFEIQKLFFWENTFARLFIGIFFDTYKLNFLIA